MTFFSKMSKNNNNMCVCVCVRACCGFNVLCIDSSKGKIPKSNT